MGSSSEPKQLDLLIGFDHMYDILTGSFLRGPRGAPVDLESRFGWFLHGPYGWRDLATRSSSGESHCFHIQSNIEPTFSEFVDRLSDNDLIATEEPLPSWSTPVL